MEKLFFEYSQKCEHYHLKDSSGFGFYHLAYFLTDDVGCRSFNSWKEWFNDPKSTWVGSNYSDWEKDGDNLSLGFSGDVDDDAPRWETTVEQMNYILDRWQEVCEKKPKRVIINRDDNGKITVDFED